MVPYHFAGTSEQQQQVSRPSIPQQQSIPYRPKPSSIETPYRDAALAPQLRPIETPYRQTEEGFVPMFTPKLGADKEFRPIRHDESRLILIVLGSYESFESIAVQEQECIGVSFCRAHDPPSLFDVFAPSDSSRDKPERCLNICAFGNE